MQKLNRIYLLSLGRRLGAWLAFLLCLLLLTSSGWSAEEAKPEAPPAAKPEAAATRSRRKSWQQACDLLKSAQQFSFKAEVTDDRVYTGGKKLQFAFDLEAFVQRPDKLRINAAGRYSKTSSSSMTARPSPSMTSPRTLMPSWRRRPPSTRPWTRPTKSMA